MSFKNKLIEIKNKYLTRNSLTTKFSLYYGIILIVILGIALSMGVIGVLFYLRLGINDVEEFVEILIKTSMLAFCLGAFLIIIISPILSKKIRKQKQIMSYVCLIVGLAIATIIKNEVISNMIIFGYFIQTCMITRIAYKLTKNKYGYEVYENA